jgi:hypothetical protein
LRRTSRARALSDEPTGRRRKHRSHRSPASSAGKGRRGRPGPTRGARQEQTPGARPGTRAPPARFPQVPRSRSSRPAVRRLEPAGQGLALATSLASQLVRLDPPLDVRIATQGAQPSTRGVEEDGVETTREGRPSSIGGHDPHVGGSPACDERGQAAQAPWRSVGSDHPAGISHQVGHQRRLAPRGRTGVEKQSGDRSQVSDQLGALVLKIKHRSVGQGRESSARCGAPSSGNLEGFRHQAGVDNLLRGVGRAWVQPKDCLGGDQRCSCPGQGGWGPQAGQPANGQPVGKRPLRGEPSQGIEARVRKGGRALAGQAPQHSIRQARRPGGDRLGQLDGLGHRGPVRHPEVQDLVGAQPQNLQHRGVELVQGTAE